MAGYKGYSMSNNAVSAYLEGEKPLSKWTKADILSEAESYIEGESVDFEMANLSKLNVSELKDMLLRRSSWHHTSLMYNSTDFYSFSGNRLDTLTNEQIEEIISSRTKREKAEEQPLFVTAYVSYDCWEGTRKHPKKVTYEEVVRYMSGDKLISVKNVYEKKRLSSLRVMALIEQKTKFATDEAVMKKYNKGRKRGFNEKSNDGQKI